MNPSELTERLMAQARELQSKMTEAASKNAEQVRPYLEQSMATASAMQKTLTEHAQKSAALNKDYADKALGHLSELMRLGAEALRANAEQARTMTQAMADHARRAYETTSAASGESSGKKP